MPEVEGWPPPEMDEATAGRLRAALRRSYREVDDWSGAARAAGGDAPDAAAPILPRQDERAMRGAGRRVVRRVAGEDRRPQSPVWRTKM
jgi:hypothetical protein